MEHDAASHSNELSTMMDMHMRGCYGNSSVPGMARGQPVTQCWLFAALPNPALWCCCHCCSFRIFRTPIPLVRLSKGWGKGAALQCLGCRAGCSESELHCCRYVAQKHAMHPCAHSRARCTAHIVARHLTDSSVDPKHTTCLVAAHIMFVLTGHSAAGVCCVQVYTR